MLCDKQMQQSSATNQLGLYYRFLTFARARASYSQTCSDTKPMAPRLKENRNAPYSSPEIEEKSSRIQHFLA